ncbi:MAG TPA: DNA-formamidopyrimidine glycosylase family protein [Kofleriaceae bacterium]
MPEGHTLHKAARKQAPLLVGARIRASSPQGRFEEAALLDRAQISAIEAFGKHLFYRFDRRGRTGWLHVHLGLAGRFDLFKQQPPPAPRPSVRLRMAGPVHTVDLRGPLICEVVDAARRDAVIDRLGPDPIRPRSQPARFAARLAHSRVAIGAMLLDQGVIAGVGNVYRAELLYLARIDPRRPAKAITPDELAMLWRLARTLMRAGVIDGRIVTTKHGGIAPLHPGQRTYAYKQHRCARCQGPIDHVKLAGRPCYFCPRCQA